MTTVFIILAAASWAILSAAMFYRSPTNGFWGDDSWKRKYQLDANGVPVTAPKSLYYWAFKITYKERFPLSATVLVFVTDGFHLMQWFCVKFTIAAITLDPVDYLFYWLVWSAAFQITLTIRK